MSRVYVYALALLLLTTVFGGLTATAYKYKNDATAAKSDAARARADLETAKAVLENNRKAMADLQARADRDAALAAELQEAYDTAAGTMLALAQNLALLKSGNPDVESYLRQPVPDDLRRMYDR